MCIGSGINAGPPTPRSPSSKKKKTTRRPTVKEEEEEEEETTTRERLVASLYAKPRTLLTRFNAFRAFTKAFPFLVVRLDQIGQFPMAESCR